MKKNLLILFFCFLLAGQVSGFDGKVKSAIVAKTGSLVVIEPEKIANSRAVWNLNFPAEFSNWQESEGKLFLAMPAGRVSFSLIVIPNDNKKALQNIRYIIEPENQKEEKKESENLTGLKKSDFLVLIEESGERDAETAKIVNSEFWKLDLLNSGYNQPAIFDADSEQGKGWIDEASVRGQPSETPFFAIMTEGGVFVKTFNADSVDTLKKKIGK